MRFLSLLSSSVRRCGIKTTTKWYMTFARKSFFGLLRPSTRVSRVNTSSLGEMPCGSHTAAHKLAQGSAAARAASNWRSSKASKQYGKACLKLILTRHGRGRVPPATALDICDCNPIEECAAPAPDVQDQPQQHLSPSGRHIVPPVEFTLFCARVAFPAYSIGAGSLIDGRIRR